MTNPVKRSYTPLTNNEVATIIDLSISSNKTNQKTIATALGREPSIVCITLKKYKNGDPRILKMYADAKSGILNNVVPVAHKMRSSGKVKEIIADPSNDVSLRPANGDKLYHGKHGAKKHVLRKVHKHLDRKELQLLKDAKNSNMFVTEYYKLFGFEQKTNAMLNDVWKYREDILEYEADKEIHNVVAKKRVIVERIKQKTVESVIDEETIAIAEKSNKMSELIQLTKESITLQNRINELLEIAA